METAISIFNREAQKISPLLQEFSSYILSRIDYCINFSLSELAPACSAEQIMYLIKKANIPSSYKEWMQYDEISHRWKSKPGSFYLINHSVHINCYSKYLQLKEKSEENLLKNLSPIPPEILDKSRDILRFEVQCLYHKTHSLLKKAQQSETYNYYYEYEDLFKTENCITEINKYYGKTIGRGDWYTLQEAIQKITRQGFNKQKERRLIEALQLVNQCRSVVKAKDYFGKHDINSFKRTLKELSRLGINPVTIPKEWRIKHIPNLLTTYFDKVNDEKRKYDMEKFQMEVLEEYVREFGCLPQLDSK